MVETAEIRLRLGRDVQVDIAGLRAEVAPFVRERRSLENWSQAFFLQVIERIETGH